MHWICWDYYNMLIVWNKLSILYSASTNPVSVFWEIRALRTNCAREPETDFGQHYMRKRCAWNVGDARYNLYADIRHSGGKKSWRRTNDIYYFSLAVKTCISLHSLSNSILTYVTTSFKDVLQKCVRWGVSLATWGFNSRLIDERLVAIVA